MTLARLLETGSGQLAARLVIEGLAVEFVSDPGMEKTTPLDGRERIYCFDLFGPSAIGLVIDESVNIPEAVLEVPGTSIRLFEREDEALAQALWHRPNIERWITQNIDVADTTVTLLSADGIADGDVVYVGTETMLVIGVASNVLTVTRAYRQSIAQKHWSNEGGLPMRTLHNRPMRIRGRRCYLYLYGDADDLQAEGGNGGNPVWIGHVSGEPAVDDAGTVWRLQLASNAERLKGTIGGELDEPLVPRGIYYSWAAALRISIGENNDIVVGPEGAGIADFTGFYETQQEFCDALTTWLGTLKAGINANAATTIASTYTAIPTADGRWTVQVVVGSAVTDVVVHVQSSQDGETSPQPADMSDVPNAGGPGSSLTLASGDVIFPLWIQVVGDERLVPRGHFDAWSTGPLRPARDPSVQATYPSTRVYLDRSVSSDWTRLVVTWPDGANNHTIEALDTTSNYIEIARRPSFDPRGYIDYRYGAYSLASFSPTRTLGNGTLDTLRAGLVSAGPEYCNRAGTPFLTSSDLASWADVIAEAARDRPWLAQRLYTIVAGVDLEDLLQHEMRLFGVFPIVDSNGKIGVQRLERVTSGGVATDIDDELVSVGWSSMQRAQQTVNTVELKTGYDPKEDEWLGRTIVSQDMISYAQDHEERTLTIEPRSVAVIGDELIPPADAVDVMRRVSDIFGHPHDFVTVNLPWVHFSLRLGDPVTFSADHLPDYRTGARPLTEARGIVVARRWALGEAHGVVRILVHGLNVRGYSPTARITSQSNPSGNDWLLTVNPTLYAPADANTDTFFVVGFKIRVIEIDSESPTIVTGEVTSVDTDTHVIGVTLDGAWTPGSDTWELCFDSWENVVDDQRIYAAIAVDGLLNDGSDTTNAHVYAP